MCLCRLPVACIFSPTSAELVLQALLSLWQARKHAQGVGLIIPCMMRCSPSADEAKIRRGLVFHDDGTLKDWSLYGCRLNALPEEFSILHTTGVWCWMTMSWRACPKASVALPC